MMGKMANCESKSLVICAQVVI